VPTVNYLWYPNSTQIPGTCAQYPGLQGGGALGDASTPGKPAGSIAASAHGGTYSHVAVAGGTCGVQSGAAAATAAAAARRLRATPTGQAVYPPRSAPAHGGRGGRHSAPVGRWDGPPRDGASILAATWRQEPPTSCRNRSRRAGRITRGSSWARRTPEVTARGRRAQLGGVRGGRGAGAVQAL